jgi:hypothetical protein
MLLRINENCDETAGLHSGKVVILVQSKVAMVQVETLFISKDGNALKLPVLSLLIAVYDGELSKMRTVPWSNMPV